MGFPGPFPTDRGIPLGFPDPPWRGGGQAGDRPAGGAGARPAAGSRSTGPPSPSPTWPVRHRGCPRCRAGPGRVPGPRRPPGGQHRRPRLRPGRGRRPRRPGPLRLLRHGDCAAGVRLRRAARSWRQNAVVVAGGAGFIGASLVDRLQAEGDEVVVVDDLSHGHLANLTEARRRGGVRFHRMDVAQGGLATLADRVRADACVHLATTIDPSGPGRTRPPRPASCRAGSSCCGRRRTGARAVLVSSGAYSTRPSSPGPPGPATSPAGAPWARPAWPWRPTPALSAPAASRSPRWSSARSTGRDRTRSAPAWWPGPPGRCSRTSRPGSTATAARSATSCSWTTPSTPSPGPSTPPRPRAGAGRHRHGHRGPRGRRAAGRPDRLGRRAAWAPARPATRAVPPSTGAAAGKALNWQPWTRLEEGLGLTVDWLKARSLVIIVT